MGIARSLLRLAAVAALACTPAPGGAAAQGDGPPMDPATGALKPPPIAPGSRLGVAHMLPRYKPNGVLGPDVLPAGAEDAYRLGFRTLKIGMNIEVTTPQRHYYSLPDEALARVKSIVDLARLDAFKKVLDMPFQTFFLCADAIAEEGHWGTIRGVLLPSPEPDRPFTSVARENIYRQIYDLSKYLLTTYKGSGKVFILQNHESDWHVVREPSPASTPSDIALANLRDYFDLRQKAVDDARREVGATDVYLYHLAEVNEVAKAMAGNKTVTNNVIPLVHPDLVGYSVWDTPSVRPAQFQKAIAFLRARSNDSFAFGNNNVVITELGLAECALPDYVGVKVTCFLVPLVMNVPWVLHWTLYDNECYVTKEGVKDLALDAKEKDCTGTWVRKPDGSLGRLFRAYRPYLAAENPFALEPTDPDAYVDELYLATLGRKVDPQARAGAVALIRTRPWDKESLLKVILASAEYKNRTAGSSAAVTFDVYRVLMGRDPEPRAMPYLLRAFTRDPERTAYVDRMINTEEGRRRYVTWLYRKALGQPPDAAGLAWGLEALKTHSRQQLHAAFLQGPAAPRGLSSR